MGDGIISSPPSDHFKSSEMVQVAGAIVIYYGIGSVIGPVLGSQFMRWIGPTGLFLSMTLVAGTALRLCVYPESKNSCRTEAKSPVPAVSENEPIRLQDAPQGTCTA